MSATDVAAASRAGRQALAEALRHVGVRESPPGSNRTMFGRWFGADGVPWCAIFASYCFSVGAGVNARGVAYVPTLEAWLRGTGRQVPAWSAPAPGDLAVFDWDGGLPDHVGIVIAAHGREGIETVEGNTGVGNDSDGGQVMRRRRRIAQVSTFGRL